MNPTAEGIEPYPSFTLRDYAFIADGQRGALCGPHGDIAWMCAPRWDSPAVCATLIGGGGQYAVTPVDRFVWGGYYEPGTLIWRNRWTTEDTIVECRDALAYPGDRDRVVLLRQITAPERDVTVRVVLDLRADFGRQRTRRLRCDDDGRWTAEVGDLRMRWQGAADARATSNGALVLEITVPGGTQHDLVLEIGPTLTDEPPEPRRLWTSTEAGWQDAVPSLEATVAPRDARHAYAVLRGMTSAGGGMVAAATLGLPERAEAGKNYDYRYVWLRDQAFAGIAAAVDQPTPLLDDAVAYATARLIEHGPDIAPAYRIDGGPLPKEEELDLPGYPGGTAVTGNWVRGQFQLDAIGELLTLFAVGARHDRLEGDARLAMTMLVDLIRRRWQEPDAGIWELDNRWWTHSRLACVAGLRTAARTAPAGEAGELTTLADEILAETSRRCLHPQGYWRRSPDLDSTDTALALPPVRGALPADDPRTRETLRRVREHLTEDGYAYRYAADARPLGVAEGAFLLCGFALSLAEWHAGDTVDAFRWFERTRAACGTAGLFAEEYDVQQRQLRGNLPQAFVHAALLEAAGRLSQAPPRPNEPGSSESRQAAG